MTDATNITPERIRKLRDVQRRRAKWHPFIAAAEDAPDLAAALDRLLVLERARRIFAEFWDTQLDEDQMSFDDAIAQARREEEQG